jgi:UDP-N-acetylglucosamine/UDP-N-acetylgalactosamine diphosphorylase
MDEHRRTGVAETLERHGQDHLLAGLSELDPETRDRFLDRLAHVDWEELARPAEPPPLEAVEPPAVVTLAERRRRADALIAAGETAYREGRVAVLMVAGGQGTRLGFPGPKGCFPLAPHSGKSIYQLQAEKVLSLSRRVGREIPFLVMTSPATDAETREFFAAHGRFGLAGGQACFFVQGTVPSLDRHGRGLLAAPGALLENPDGHGGSFTALAAGGLLDELRAGGVTHLVYLQVDNVLAPVDDPALVGLAVSERADVVTKVLEKAHPDEKVGNLVTVAGRDRVVEYTELSPEQARAPGPDGEPLFRWGSPALHCWSVEFLSRLASQGFRPPLHRSAKPLEAWADGSIAEVEGWKHERFVFGLIPEAERSIGLEIEREAEFAPVKNAEGPDSPATAVELAHRQYVEWLEAAGVRVGLPSGERVEIDPLLAATRSQFLERWDGRLRELTSGCYLEATDRAARGRRRKAR